MSISTSQKVVATVAVAFGVLFGAAGITAAATKTGTNGAKQEISDGDGEHADATEHDQADTLDQANEDAEPKGAHDSNDANEANDASASVDPPAPSGTTASGA